MPSIEPNKQKTPAASSRRIQDGDVHHISPWKSTFIQFLRYCMVGGVNTLIDVLILNVLLWRFPTNNVQVLVAYNSIAYSSGTVSSFFLNKYWTFGRKQRTTKREVVRFVISLCLEVLYSNGLIWLAGKALQPLIANPTLWGNASKLVAIAGGTVLSYTFMRFWIFAKRSQKQPEKPETIHQAQTVTESATEKQSKATLEVSHIFPTERQ